jgi:hypothetical protein
MNIILNLIEASCSLVVSAFGKHGSFKLGGPRCLFLFFRR